MSDSKDLFPFEFEPPKKRKTVVGGIKPGGTQKAPSEPAPQQAAGPDPSTPPTGQSAPAGPLPPQEKAPPAAPSRPGTGPVKPRGATKIVGGAPPPPPPSPFGPPPPKARPQDAVPSRPPPSVPVEGPPSPSAKTVLVSQPGVASPAQNRRGGIAQDQSPRRGQTAALVSELAASRARTGDVLSKSSGDISEDDRSKLLDMLQALREECDRDDANVDLRWRMFQVLRQLDRQEEAKQALCSIVRIEPNNRYARQLIQQMCEPREIEDFELPKPIQPFYSDLVGLFMYPFAKGGLFTIIGGCVVFTLIQLAITGSLMLGPVGITSGSAMGLLFYGYVLSFYMRILKTSAIGQDHPPPWPDFSPTEFFQVCLKAMLVGAICAAPSVVLSVLCAVGIARFSPTAGAWVFALGMIPCALFALYYGVMGFVSLGTFGSWESVYNVPSVIRAGRLVFPELALVCLFIAAVYLALSFIFGTAYAVLMLCFGGTVLVFMEVDLAFGSVALIGGVVALVFISLFSFFYTAMVVSRILGLFYRQVERKLAW